MCCHEFWHVGERESRGLGGVWMLLMVACLAAGPLAAPAGVIFVKTTGDDASDGLSWNTAKQTVTAGLATAVAGDQLWVAGGRYVERILLKADIAIYGGFAGDEDPATFDLCTRDFVAHEAILDGDQGGSVVTGLGDGTQSCRLDGFTITDGTGTPDDTSPLLFYGGGIYLKGMSATIACNQIIHNHATEGAGLYAADASLTILRNRISTNAADTDGIESKGGGMYLSNCTGVISRNRVVGNNANRDGGGICLVSSAPMVANNLIAGNSCSREGGGLSLYRADATIVNNTIVGNVAPYWAGGVHLTISSPVIANNILAFNPPQGLSGSTTAILHTNCMYGNSRAGGRDVSVSRDDISADPRFVDPSHGNFHIRPDSPCINAGTNADVHESLDLDDQPRIQPADGIVDIGADESDGMLWPTGPYIVVRTSPAGDDANDGLSWEHAKRSIQAAADTAARAGGEVWVAAGVYYERVVLPPYAYLYGGFAGGEATRAERNWAAHTSILDGAQRGSVVTAWAGDRVSALDGFTIRHGKAARGGGFSGRSCAPYVTNNTIVDNTASAGGGVGLTESWAVFSNNLIARNYASDVLSSGGGMALRDSPAVIANTTFIANGSVGMGGGLGLNGSDAQISNITVCGNSAREGGGFSFSGSHALIANSIVAFNASGIFRSDYYGSTFICNCIYGNAMYSYKGMDDPTGTNGNISLDPYFASHAYGNVHIQPNSPCVNAGQNDYAVGAADIDGDVRILPVDGTIDIGADESVGSEWAAGPYAVVRVRPDGDDAADGSSWSLAKRTLQAGLDAAARVGGEVWAKAGTYVECVELAPYAYLYGGFCGQESMRNERDHAANITVIDADHAGSVVTAHAGYCVSGLDGFVITHGKAERGGGVFVDSGAPVITNNTVMCNNADYGGGLYATSVPCISGNTITGNTAVRGGGAMLVWSAVNIVNNHISHNNATEYGGGLFLQYGTMRIVNNEIVFNSGEVSGGGVYAVQSGAMLAGNVIASNEALLGGGGLYLNNTNSAMSANTIVANSAPFVGGGIALYYSYPTIESTIVAFNSGTGVYAAGTQAPTLRRNCVFANDLANYYGLTDPTGTNGNISLDPWLTNVAEGDYRLRAGSPCIDAGSNASVPADSGDWDADGNTTEPLPLDIAGRARFIDDPGAVDCPWGLNTCGVAPVVDMGAYERQRDGDCNGDWAIDLADLAAYEMCVAGPESGLAPGCACGDFDGDGDIDLADAAGLQAAFGQ